MENIDKPMKLVTFDHHGLTGAGLLEGDAIIVCAAGPEARHAVRRRIAEGDAARLEAWRGVARDDGLRMDLAAIALLAPVPEPRRDLFCVGKNYRAHATEFHGSGFDSGSREEIPSAPVIFTKSLAAVTGPGAPIDASPDSTSTTDYEGALGVGIGFAPPRYLAAGDRVAVTIDGVGTLENPVRT